MAASPKFVSSTSSKLVLDGLTPEVPIIWAGWLSSPTPEGSRGPRGLWTLWLMSGSFRSPWRSSALAPMHSEAAAAKQQQCAPRLQQQQQQQQRAPCCHGEFLPWHKQGKTRSLSLMSMFSCPWSLQRPRRGFVFVKKLLVSSVDVWLVCGWWPALGVLKAKPLPHRLRTLNLTGVCRSA